MSSDDQWRALRLLTARSVACPDGVVDEEKAAAITRGNSRGVVVSHDGVGDPFTYRRREGRFTVFEWVVQIAVPIAVVLLGAHTAQHAFWAPLLKTPCL
jgi:hypothetical protein